MAALALAFAEQPRSESSCRTVFVLPFTVVVTSALAVAWQSPFWPLDELEELLDEDDAFADVDTDVLSAAAIRIPVPMAVKPPIAPAARTTASSDRPLDCNMCIARSFSNEHAPADDRERRPPA
jgi:hypothetical protein